MQYVFHDTQMMLTSDAAAQALLAYFASLELAWCADEVELPAIDEDGALMWERLFVGPATRLRSMRADDDLLESPDASFVADLSRRTRALHTR